MSDPVEVVPEEAAAHASPMHETPTAPVIPKVEESPEIFASGPSVDEVPRAPQNKAPQLSRGGALDVLSRELQMPAIKRWDSPKRTAPSLNAAYLFWHTAVVWAPLYAPRLHSRAGSWAVIVLNVMYILSIAAMAVYAIKSVPVALRYRIQGQEARRLGGDDVQHVICIMICEEPDDVVMNTLKVVKNSPAAPRTRVVFAMEQRTDRQAERFALYTDFLAGVHSTKYYVHPSGLDGEVQGCCSNVAWAMNSYANELLSDIALTDPEHKDPLENFLFTKLDSQIYLHGDYSKELEYNFRVWQQEPSKRPVVFTTMILSHLNRELSHGPGRAIGAMRLLAVPLVQAWGLFAVTCYSVPLKQYIGIGGHHPSYIGEDQMMVAQTNVATHRLTKVVVMCRTPAATATPLGNTLWESLAEMWKQNKRWAGQSTEVCEFVARQSTCSVASIAWLALYGWIKILVTDGIGCYMTVATIAGIPSDIPKVEADLLLLSTNLIGVTLALAVFGAPILDQVMACTLRCSLPLWQLPFTIICSLPALLFVNFTNIVAFWHLLLVGKPSIVHTARAKESSRSADNAQTMLASTHV